MGCMNRLSGVRGGKGVESRVGSKGEAGEGRTGGLTGRQKGVLKRGGLRGWVQWLPPGQAKYITLIFQCFSIHLLLAHFIYSVNRICIYKNIYIYMNLYIFTTCFYSYMFRLSSSRCPFVTFSFA